MCKVAQTPYSSGMTTYMTKSEAADFLRVSESTIDRYVRAGQLGRFKVAGLQSTRFRRDEVEAMIVPDNEEAAGALDATDRS